MPPTTKALVLIDAVNWSDLHPAEHPLRNVGRWFRRWLPENDSLRIEVLTPNEHQPVTLPTWTDAVIMSGSPRDAWDDDPMNLKFGELILECQRHSIPFLGVCYGHQLLGRMLGGNVARDPQGLELGNFTMQLTEKGQRSPLFRDFPPQFDVLQSHQDAVLSLPPGADLLAVGTQTFIQSFSVDDRLFGVQFHPEADPDIFRFLWEPRRTAWRQRAKFDFDERLSSLRPTPLTPRIFTNFTNYFLR